MSINPFDEIALEAAIQLKEKHKFIQSIVSASIVTQSEPKDFIRTALSFGLEKAYQIETASSTDSELTPLQIAKCLQYVCKIECPSIILMGKQSIDSELSSVPSALAHLLSMRMVSNLSKV